MAVVEVGTLVGVADILQVVAGTLVEVGAVTPLLVFAVTGRFAQAVEEVQRAVCLMAGGAVLMENPVPAPSLVTEHVELAIDRTYRLPLKYR